MASQVVRLSALPACFGLVSFKVYASSKNQHERDLIKPEQLSVYNEPSTNCKFVVEQPGRLLKGISALRQTVQPFAAQCKGAYNAVRSGTENSIAFGKGAYVLLKNPPEGFFPRVGVVTVSGLAGLVLASKGSRVQKMVYPVGLAAVGMAICYPQQAIAVAKFSGQKMYAISQGSYEAIRSLWKESPQQKQGMTKNENLEITKRQGPQPNQERFNRVEGNGPPLAENQQPTLSEIVFVPAEEKLMIPLDPDLLDHGQANPEDTDLYTTRS
ncbi:MICOS complex subunit MIC27-like [Pristis pectinata]|uniref:MICOS complex subunit MIC27-like n=1 Tax=Pristis pectinata TaxID=685728 RepID=UPI00223E2C17|nr:MICOS complex subunit MIC27-like [Pristis pectinata]